MVLLKLVEKRLGFALNWTTAWHHGVSEAPLNTHLQPLDRWVIVVIAVAEQPSLVTPT